MIEFSNDDELVIEFQKNIFAKAEEIDPNDEQDWFSLALGWAIAKGLKPEDAHLFAVFVRYRME